MKQDDGSYIYAWRLPKRESKGFAIIRNLDERSCNLTWTHYCDQKGLVLRKVMKTQIPRVMRPIFQAHERFNRDDEVDKIE